MMQFTSMARWVHFHGEAGFQVPCSYPCYSCRQLQDKSYVEAPGVEQAQALMMLVAILFCAEQERSQQMPALSVHQAAGHQEEPRSAGKAFSQSVCFDVVFPPNIRADCMLHLDWLAQTIGLC
jgi:hypothetical protein